MNITGRENLAPLTPQAFHALLALAKFQDTGYGIRVAVQSDTNGAIVMTSGTIYPLLKRMSRLELVEELEPQSGSGPHGINKVYRLTDLGRLILSIELDRYGKAVQLAQDRMLQ